MPFAGYTNFADCVKQNQDKGDPDAYCATIMRAVEGKILSEDEWLQMKPCDQAFFLCSCGSLMGELRKARDVGGFESPEPGDLPEGGKQVLARVYAECRAGGNAKEKCAKIAWGAVQNAGFKSETKSWTFLTNAIGSEEILDSKGNKRFYVTGYISTPDIDIVNDLVTPQALDGMLQQIKSSPIPLKIDYEHESVDAETGQLKSIIPVGKIVDARRDEKGLWVKAELNSALERFGEIWESVKKGFLDAFSITFRVKDRTFRMINGLKTRVINGLDLINVALTGTPVNPQASITEVFAKAMRWEAQMEQKTEAAQAEKKAEYVCDECGATFNYQPSGWKCPDCGARAVRLVEKSEEKMIDPHTEKWLRCVEKVRAAGGAQNPYAVCTAVLGRESFKSEEMLKEYEAVKALMTEEEKPMSNDEKAIKKITGEKDEIAKKLFGKLYTSLSDEEKDKVNKEFDKRFDEKKAEEDIEKLREAAAKEKYGKSWAELTTDERKEIDKSIVSQKAAPAQTAQAEESPEMKALRAEMLQAKEQTEALKKENEELKKQAESAAAEVKALQNIPVLKSPGPETKSAPELQQSAAKKPTTPLSLF